MNHQVKILMREAFAVIEKQPPHMVRKLETTRHRLASALEQLHQDMAA